MLIVEQLNRVEEIGGNNYLYSYRMIKKEVVVPFYDCSTPIQGYGIEVERQELVNGVVVNIERDIVATISPYRHKVRELLKVLYANCVSPIHLIDVLGEYIDEYVIDFNGSDFIKVCTN
ncbi:DUF6514 family protein [Clostridium frigidicarnis]|uniref:Uncharacterized protein n=1 Tax=Clostridium frigidicarnis TaxID=84698 RepID=A0A1I1B0U3_9CLOT|nr:DUF6514 family protein [Clostridium frigidicarnis]SFB42288.1 hypothetical protein SAMN04488528_10506 [Clostridium frigidicarnis]